jgi:hypothetical protein
MCRPVLAMGKSGLVCLCILCYLTVCRLSLEGHHDHKSWSLQAVLHILLSVLDLSAVCHGSYAFHVNEYGGWDCAGWLLFDFICVHLSDVSLGMVSSSGHFII